MRSLLLSLLLTLAMVAPARGETDQFGTYFLVFVFEGGLEPPTFGCPAGSGDCGAAADVTVSTANSALNHPWRGGGLATGWLKIHAARGTVSVGFSTYTKMTPNIGPGGVGGSTPNQPASYFAIDIPATITASTITQSGAFTTGTVAMPMGSASTQTRRSVTVSNLSCSIAAGIYDCTVTFGPSGFTNISGRDWQHTFHVRAN